MHALNQLDGRFWALKRDSNRDVGKEMANGPHRLYIPIVIFLQPFPFLAPTEKNLRCENFVSLDAFAVLITLIDPVIKLSKSK